METQNTGAAANILLSLGSTDFSQLSSLSPQLPGQMLEGRGLVNKLSGALEGSPFGDLLNQHLPSLPKGLEEPEVDSEVQDLDLASLDQEIHQVADLTSDTEAAIETGQNLPLMPLNRRSVADDEKATLTVNDEISELDEITLADQSSTEKVVQTEIDTVDEDAAAYAVSAQQPQQNVTANTNQPKSANMTTAGERARRTDNVSAPIAQTANAADASAETSDDAQRVNEFVPVTAQTGEESSEQSLETSLQPQKAVVAKPVASAAQTATTDVISAQQDATEQMMEEEAIEQAQQQEEVAQLEKNEKQARKNEQIIQLDKNQQMWGDKISERISMMAGKNIQSATIHLDPPELGSLEIKMQINAEQTAQIQVQAQGPQIKEVLESSAQRLRDMLEQEGIALDQFDVSDQSSAFASSDGSSSQGEQDSEYEGSEMISDEEITERVFSGNSKGLLDTFA